MKGYLLPEQVHRAPAPADCAAPALAAQSVPGVFMNSGSVLNRSNGIVLNFIMRMYLYSMIALMNGRVSVVSKVYNGQPKARKASWSTHGL